MVRGIAWRLENAAGLPYSSQVRERIFEGLGYDWITRKVRPEGRLCCRPMAELKVIVRDVLVECGLEEVEAQNIMDKEWFLPNPKEDARPLANLRRTFKSLHGLGVAVAILTADSRKGTLESLKHLDVNDLVDFVVCGDDGLQQALPEAVWAICRACDVKPENAIMVGDTDADMRVGQNARVALTVGVIEGASQATDLAAECDVLIPDVSKVPKLAYQLLAQATANSENGFPGSNDELRMMTAHKS